MDLNYKTLNLFPSNIHILEIDNFDNYKDQIVKDIYDEKDKDYLNYCNCSIKVQRSITRVGH